MVIILLIILEVLGLALVPHILLSNKRPVSTLNWILVVTLLPAAGPLMYIFIGNDRMRRKRLRGRYRDVDISRATKRTAREASHISHATRRLLKAVSRINDHPITVVDEVDAYYSGETYYTALLQSIHEATRFVHLQVYLWRNDETGRQIRDALVEAVGRGVDVRLLVDEIGSIHTGEDFFRPVIDAGGRFTWCLTVNPLRNRFFFNLRNHRKLTVIDGTIAYIGGINIGSEYAGRDPLRGKWWDLQIRVTGEAVYHLHDVFRTDWYFATAEEIDPVPEPEATAADLQHLAVVTESGPDAARGAALNTLLALIAHARKHIDLITPYFVPDPVLINTLQTAAAGDIDIRLMIATRIDQPYMVDVGRAFYEDLLKYDIGIYEYAEAFHHTKAAIVDRRWLLVGSANLDVRSFHLNFEAGLVFHSPELARELSGHFDQMFDASQHINREAFTKRPVMQKFKENMLKIWAPML